MSAPLTSAAPTPRGFVIDRGDGRPPLPGSLHTNRRLSQWLSLDEPGVVQVFTGKAELGQGILTALQLIVAEELDLPGSAVRVHSASTVRGPDEGVTSGSLSIQDSGGALRQVCAEVRELALHRAAARVGSASAGLQGEPPSRASVAGGGSAEPVAALSVDALRWDSGRILSPQGELIGDLWSLVTPADLDAEASGLARPKPAAARTLLGRARPPRLDLPDKVFGHARFIQDLRLPGLLHGRVLRPPTLDSTLGEAAQALVQHLPAGVCGWIDGRFVAVVAEVERDADAAAAQLASRLPWQAGAPLPDAHDLPGFLRQAPHQTTVSAERGEPAAPASPADWPAGGLRHHAVYLKPYLAHASIGTSCALARWDGQRLEVWSHSQGIHNLRDDLVRALEREAVPVPREAISIHHVEGSGCYGHNGADDVALDAVLMALRCPGRPVRVLWSRADELTHSPFGPAQLVALDARVDEQGQLTHWQHELWANGYSSRPGRANTPTLLAASERADATPLPLPINPPLSNGGGADRNAVPAYAVPNLKVINHRLTVMPLRTSAMRALGAFANVFAIESFVDELARARGDDPLAFRRRHLGHDPRALAVLEAVVQHSDWWGRRTQEADDIGHGLAWARYKNSGAWCAVIARVQVAEQVRVLNLDIAVDVGLVVDLDGVINQIEGGALQSLSWTLKEQVGFEYDRLTSHEWAAYPVLRFGDVPEVRVQVLDRPDEAPLGAGEAAQGPVAGALANAVFDALGVRLRSLPLSADNLLRALHAAEVAT